MGKNIGQLIAEARKKKKISQEELAEKLHVSRQTLSYWETGRSEPTANMLISICKILNIDISNIIKDEDSLIKLVDIEKKKTSRIYLIFIFLLIVVVILLASFLIIIFNSNKFTVYELQLDSDNYYLDDGILILSKEKNYFNLGRLYSKNESIDENIDYYIKIYEIINGEECLILEKFYDDNVVISENYGYNEYFNSLDANNNLFLDISYIEDDEIVTVTSKILLKEIMKSDAIIYLKNKAIGTDEVVKEDNSPEISISALKDCGYELDENWTYIKNNNSSEVFSYNLITKSLYYSNESTTIQYNLESYIMSALKYDKNNEIILSFDYFTDTQELICLSGSCNDYIEYVEIITSELKNLRMQQILT